jgi:hypothetical protein
MEPLFQYVIDSLDAVHSGSFGEETNFRSAMRFGVVVGVISACFVIIDLFLISAMKSFAENPPQGKSAKGFSLLNVTHGLLNTPSLLLVFFVGSGFTGSVLFLSDIAEVNWQTVLRISCAWPPLLKKVVGALRKENP